MKKSTTRLLLAIIASTAIIIASCSKGGQPTPSSGYTCVCDIHWGANQDTTMSFPYGSIEKSEATSRCTEKAKQIKLMYGNNTSCAVK
jgi:hypothetical protein